MIRTLGLGALAFGTSGCWLMLGLDDNEYNRGAAPGGDGVLVQGEQPFYIDATEVTMRAYVDWVLTEPSTDGQDGRCTWNDTFAPGVLSAGAEPGCTDGGEGTIDYELEANLHPSFPARCVDWCDAYAYCAAHDKHLYGRIGGGGIQNTDVAGDFVDVAVSEWFAACSGLGATAFAYGDAIEAGRCRDSQSHTEFGPTEVGTETCEGGVPGVFDMSGNVHEWVDACFDDQDPAVEACIRGGGSFALSAPDELDCADDGTSSNLRRQLNDSTGFRCCWEP